MCTGNGIKLYALVAGMILVLVTWTQNLYAEDVSVFKITDTEGYVGLRYRYDSDLTQQTPSPATEEIRSVFEEKASVLTHGYIYHPNLLKVDLGAGIIFSQEDLQTVTGSVEHDDTLHELSARLMFLEKKPYPLTLYYDKSHPSVALTVTDVFIQENEKYGMNFSLRQPVSPVTFDVETYQQSTKGNSFTQILDDRITYQSISATSNFINGGHTQLSYTENQQESMSGSTNSPIQPFNVTSKTTELNSLFVLDKNRKSRFSFIATQIIQEQDRELKETRLLPNLTWQHSDNFNSFYRYSLLDREQPGVETHDTSGAAGLRYEWNKNLYSNGDVHFNKNKTTGLELNSYGANAAITYKHQLGFGLLQFNVGLNHDVYDREAPGVVDVVDANYTLTGNTPVTLAHDYINTATIVVRREDTNEVLTEGLDYVVVVITKQTQIQKINPALPATLAVLVSYQYDPGGTASYNSTGQSYQTSLELYEHFTFYVNYRDLQYNLKSGLPTLPLDSSDTTSYGLRIDYPLPTDIAITVGGELLNEKHNENISSYRKNSTDLFMQIALGFSSDLQLNFTQLQVDNLYSDEDVDLVRYSLRLKSHPVNRLTLSLQLSDEKDTGASLLRYYRNTTLSAQWRIRRLLLELSARKNSNTQGLVKNERTIFNFNLRREF